MTEAIEAGIPKLRIEEAAARTQARIDSGRQPVIGVNKYRPEHDEQIDVLKVDNNAVRAEQLEKLRRLRAERDDQACADALDQLTAAGRAAMDGTRGPGLGQTCSPSRSTPRGRRRRSGRSASRWRRCSGATPQRSVRSRVCTGTRSASRRTSRRSAALADEFAERHGRRPRILVAKMGQDGHDRGQKVIATAFADLGFDVDVGPLFQTPAEVARQAVEADVHVVGVSSLAAGHLTLVPELRAALAAVDRPDIMIVVGGVIPSQDFEALHAAGADARSSRRARSSPTRPPTSSTSSPCGSVPRARRSRAPAGEGRSVAGPAIDVDAYVEGVRAGNRTVLGRAITLVESSRPADADAAQELLTRLLPESGTAHRIGITGVPGAGKSTFIDALGSDLTATGHRVAVLAVDPSSSRTGGSILGDKTRMANLAVDPDAFIRPSPTSGTLGGVTRSTRETIVVVEAAGYDVVLVETVGVGQSETAVANMVDTFLLLMLARAGDELQGIKKGILELADVIAVNKADGPHAREAEQAARELAGALHLVTPPSATWQPAVLTCSAAEHRDLDAVWERVEAHRRAAEATGEFARNRERQQIDWMWSMVHDRVVARLRSDPAVRERLPELEQAVRDGRVTPTAAATELLDLAAR